nr:immunoglobulin light chain junction region [Macaca mulatta]MOW58627.1 immunoglobulin light chain junction region [Macaca mulatta]MOW60668.1 immunoglobulin light chain junction region [Macaca mulatta]MOW60749.1 immunoglobulin light chain junction region [Macaca mulatta]MOW61631.1 immunoglobulin light chain junction region [Macaca mulatta]
DYSCQSYDNSLRAYIF